jgi:WD40 repeat protein
MKRLLVVSLVLPIVACGTAPISSEFTGVDFEPTGTAEPIHAEIPTGEFGGPPDEEPLVQPEETTAVLGCENPAQRWFNAQQNWWIDTGWLGILGDDQFVVHAQQIANSETVSRASDGSSAGSLLTPVAIEYDDAQTTGIYWAQEVFEIREVASQRVLHTIELPGGNWQTYRMEMSPDGRTVASARCSEDGENLEIEAFELASGGRQSWAIPTNGSVYCPGWASHNAIPFDVAADTVITADAGTGTVIVLSTIDGSMRTVVAHEPDSDVKALWYEQPVLDVAIRPDGSEFATSGLDGSVRRWRLDDLSRIDERDSSWIVVNTQTYTTPFAVSPLLYSHDGQTLAYTARDDRAGLVNLQTGNTEVFIPTASDEPTGHMRESVPNWGIAELGFSREDRAVIVVETGGTQLFGCAKPVRTEPAVLEFAVDAERMTRVGEAWTFDIQVLSGQQYVSGQSSLNGLQLAPLRHLNEWSWVFNEAGTQTFRLLLDDGRTSVDEVFEIEVVP